MPSRIASETSSPARHHLLRLEAELAARRDFRAQQVAGRDVRHLQVFLQAGRLRALARTGRAQEDQSHPRSCPKQRTAGDARRGRAPLARQSTRQRRHSRALLPQPGPGPRTPTCAHGTLLYAQSGGVTAVINATACGVIETARKARIGKVYAGRNGILGALPEDLIDTGKETAAAIRALRAHPGGAFGSCRYKLKSLEDNRAQYERLIEVFKAHDIG